MSQLHVVDLEGDSRPYFAGKVSVSDVAWSNDGRFLFFMSSRPTLEDGHSGVPLDYGDLQRMATEPGNGNPDVWWVSAELVEALRPEGW